MSALQPACSGKFVFQSLATFLPMALLVCGAAYYFYYSTQDRAAIHSRAREAVGIELSQSAINNVLQEIRRDLRFVSDHNALKNFLDQPAPGEMRDFEQDMLNLSSSSRLYDQIRWLDETGMERVRVNFNNGNPVITPAEALQNQRTRYYFPAAFKLEQGEAYISPLDLNVENDHIEIPYKPMLRIGTPVFDSHGDKRGIVLLNYFGAKLLAHFDKATAGIADHAMLLNQDGYWLKSPKPDDAWGFMFGRDQLTLARRHPAAWQRILAAESGQFEDAEGLWTFKTLYPGLQGQQTPDLASFWKVVVHLPPHELYGNQPLLKPMLAALVILLLLQFVGSWKLVRIRRLRNEAQDQVRHTNQADGRLHMQSSALEAAANAIVITDTEGFIQWANPAYFRLTGYAQKESLGKHPKDLINSGSQDQAFWKTFWQAIKNGHVWHGEVINKRKDGVLYTEEMTVTPVRDERGEIAHFVAVKEDISARKKTEEILREKEFMLSESQRIAHVGSWQLDLPAGTITWSDETYRLYGVSPETFTPDLETFYTLIHADDRAAMREWTRACLAGEHPGELEFRAVRPDGNIRVLSGRGDVQYDAYNRPIRMAGTAQDITEYKRVEQNLLEKERFLSTIIESEPECVKLLDAENRLLRMNSAGLNMIEADSGGQVIGENVLEIVVPEHRDAFAALTRRVFAGESGVLEFEIIGLKGTRRWMDTHAVPLRDAQGEISAYLGITRDINERKQAEERLRQAAAVFGSTREGITVTDTEQRILRVNPAFCELTGYTEAEVLGQKPSLLSSGRQGRDFYTKMWASLNAAGHWQGEIWNRRKNGEVYPELLSISAIKDGSGQVTGYVGVFADISMLKASESELEFLAHHDPLTRLPNRLLLFSRLDHGIELAQRENRQLALLMFDLDRFKDVNDSFGHLAGDELLQQVGGRLTARLRGVDTVCRLGGDEFTVIVLLDGIAHPEDAGRVADEIIIALSEPWQLANGVEVRIGASVGISLFPQHGNSAAEMLQQADAALYHAKAEGRGRFMYFTENLTCAARERIELEARLRRAIAQNELRVFYQPQVDIASGRITGAEALVRWQDPLEGLIPPFRFIPVAEATGLISAVGEWVLKETCLQGRRWIEAGLPPLTLAVNVSPRQFLSGDLFEVVSRTLAATGFPSTSLELELTESALMDRQKEAVDMLNRLRGIGVRLAIDDFGTGYSSLAYLKRFPLDVLKIDKSFVDDIPDSQDDREIAATIVAMGHTLRFKVLAEGVETVEQLAFLQAQGCDSYQGYLKSPPLPAEAFAKLLAESRLE